MHTDRKIGFAMGILLIGIVAALFFRNEPLVDTAVRTVRRERELNERLRERDVAVYLTDEAVVQIPEEAATATPLRDILKSMSERPSPVSDSKAKPRPDRFAFRDDSIGGRSVQDSPRVSDSESGRIPRGQKLDSVPVVEDEDELPAKLPPLIPPLLPTLPTLPTEVEVSVAEISATEASFTPPEQFDEYVVKYGDTLSGIAQKMLGSQSKYREVYEANRDRMASPDRLDVGKPIRIPRSKPGSAEPH